MYQYFQTLRCEWYLEQFLWNCLQLNANELHWWQVNIGLGNDLVPSGNKSLPEPVLTRSVSSYGVTNTQWVNPCFQLWRLHTKHCFIQVQWKCTKCLFFKALVSFVCVFHWGCILTELFLINYSELNSWLLIPWVIALPCHKQWCYWKCKMDWGRISTTGATSEWRNHMKSLTLKRLGHFFQNVISFSNVHHKWNIFIWNYETVQYNECLFSIVDTDGLVL